MGEILVLSNVRNSNGLYRLKKTAVLHTQRPLARRLHVLEIILLYGNLDLNGLDPTVHHMLEL